MHAMSLCWIRRDLRLHDHPALSAALKQGPTAIVFVFDTHILKKLQDQDDRRLTFIHESLKEIEKQLIKKGSSLIILHGKPEEVIPRLAAELKVAAVFSNRDYEPYAKRRDELVRKELKKKGVDFHQYKDVVFFEENEIRTTAGGPYKVFTPYKNRWLEKFEQSERLIPDYKCNLSQVISIRNTDSVLNKNWLEELGFRENPPLLRGGSSQAKKRLQWFESKLDDYHEARNFPSLNSTSSLSPYLRFGNLSLRDLLRLAVSSRSEGAKTWLSELIWRDFYQMILDSYPQVAIEAYRPEYQNIRWLGTEEDFQAWCKGETGFPIVDAAMRCLNETGFMHNRLRMIVSSFLCKTLLVDWKKGEAYFARKLLDYDLASNNGGWQWSASTGCDAQPYFRIFNPYTQSQKFDEKGDFIRAWVPELSSLSIKAIHRPALIFNYPAPIVSYEKNRERALMMYSAVKLKPKTRTA